MKIVDVNGVDTGNQSYKLAQAINMRYAPEHISISFIGDPHANYLKFPYMVKKVQKQPKWVTDWWANADIIHGHNLWRRVRGFGLNANPNAVKVLHQHGRFGSDITPGYLARCDKKGKFFRIVSTINLLRYVGGDDSRWLPAPMDLKKFERIKEKHYEPHDTIRVLHSPTLRRLKHTDLFLKVMERIMKKHKNVELVMVEGKSNDECLKIKCSCDICYDQLLLQYGTNALESWAFGIPCIVGSPFRKQIENSVGFIPYYEATEDTLYDAIETLVLDGEKRTEYGELGKKYLKDFHDYPFVAEKALNIYERAVEELG